MNGLFHPVSQKTAIAALTMLPHRLKASTFITRRSPEGRNLREQARQQLRWHLLFVGMNRRNCQ